MSCRYTNAGSVVMIIQKALLAGLAIILVSQQPLGAQTTASVYNGSTGDRQNRVSVEFNSKPLADALHALARRVKVGISYNTETMPPKTVTYRGENTPVFTALEAILSGTGLVATLSDNRKVILIKEKPMPGRVIRQETITGTVTDGQSGETLPGVNILVKGTSTGTSTDSEGTFELTVESLQDTLIVSFIGYQTQDVPIQGRTEIAIEMQSQAIAGQEMVVIGYGTQEREDVTGSISSVNGEDLQALQTTNIAESLQGQVSGALITQSSGEPGAGMDVMIRGVATIGSTEPLYVVDGIPMEGGISSINTSNIESVEILKDASSAAIYGSRAANGVVMITTKSGIKGGSTQVQISARSGISNIPENRRIEVMDTRDFYEFSIDALNSAGATIPTAWEEPYLSQNLEQNTNWQDKLFRQGITQDYNLTVSGGNDNAIYSFSGGYQDERGTVVSIAYEKLTARIKSEYYIGENDQLTIGENVYLNQITKNGSTNNDTFREIYQVSPTVPYRCPENLGGFCGPTNETSPNFRVPRPSLLQLQENENTTRQLIGKAYLNFNILPNLEYNLSLSTNLSMGSETSFIPRYNLIAQTNNIRQLGLNRFENQAIIIENTLNYNFTLFENNEFEVLAGYSQEKREIEDLSGTAQGLPSSELRTINSSTGETTVNSGATASALRSFFGRVQYNYDDRYQAEFSIRRDGSSRFGINNRWGTFPSASLGWTIANEDFMNQFENLSNLKLRASWGITGSQLIPNFAARATILPVANYIFGRSQGLVSGSAILDVGNDNLKWQETEQTNIGLDVGFFNQQLDFTLDYYQKNTSNVLLRPPVAVASGIRRDRGAFQNVGAINNSGFELSGNYQKDFKDFSFQIGGNVSLLRNEVKELGVDDIIVTESDDTGTGKTITKPGSEVGAFYGYVADGIFNDQAEVDNHAEQIGAAPGDIRFKDLNGDGTINESDQTIIGSPFPDFFYGLNLNFNYRNWGLRIQMDGVQGRDILALRSDNDPKGINNTTTKYLDRWTPNNRDANYPRATNGDPNVNFRSSTFKVEDGSYLAIRNLTLSHDLYSSMLTNWVNLRNLGIFLTVSNLAWFTSYDGYNPEMGASNAGSRASLTRSLDQGTYPIARTVEVGFDLGF